MNNQFTETSLKEFLQLVYNVRDAQRQYFKTKNNGVLIRCKELERQLDEKLIPFINNGTIISRERRTGERGQQQKAF